MKSHVPALDPLASQSAQRREVLNKTHSRSDAPKPLPARDSHDLERFLRRRMCARGSTDDPDSHRELNLSPKVAVLRHTIATQRPIAASIALRRSKGMRTSL